jgi:hypothetical protein
MTRELSIQDMSAEQVELLPGRETLAKVTFSFKPVKINTSSILANNTAVAINGGVGNAVAGIEQGILVTQGNN